MQAKFSRMDADARALLELLKPAVDRAEQIESRQQALLQRQTESAEAFTAQIDETTRAAAAERARLLEARSEFDALRAAEVARGKDESDSIIAAARADEDKARARVEVLQREQAQSEAAHAAKMAQAERERAEAEAAYLERLREREENTMAQIAQLHAQSEAAHTAKMAQAGRERAEAEAAYLERLRLREENTMAQIAQLHAQSEESVAKRERRFEAECSGKRARLQSLEAKEAEVQARLTEMRRLVATDGLDAFVQLCVGGRTFESTIGQLTRFPNSALAALWQQHRQGSDPKGPMRVDGDPSLFHLVLNYLRRGKLPVVADVSQLQWLEAEAEEYELNGEGELADMCRDAYKRLDTVKVMQLLNGQRNLSGMDMRRLDLSNIDFRGASMYRARADEAMLSDAMLSGEDTNLRHASFCRANAARAIFREAQLAEARLCGATLIEASFVQAVAPKADFGKAELSDAKLGGAKLAEASFVEAVAPRADFSKAEMPSAKLGGATLTEASFAQAVAPKVCK